MDLLSGFCLDIGVMGISQSAAQSDNKIPAAPRILRRSLRSTSSYTAPEVQQQHEDALQKKGGTSLPKRRQQLKRRFAAGPKKERPLSADPIHCAKRLARRGHRAGSNALTRMQTAPPPLSEGIEHRNSPSILHACSCVTDYVGVSEYPPTASVLLSLARRSVQMQTDWARRRPFVMDVILDLKDRARDAQKPEVHVAAYAVAAVRCNYDHCNRQASQYHVTRGGTSWVQDYYSFADQASLTQSWAGQSARWDDMHVVDDGVQDCLTIVGFPESTERSTARWSTSLNCE